MELGFVVRASGESTEMNVGWAIIRQSGNPDFAEDMNPVCGDGDTNLLEVVSVKPANSASLRCSVAAKYSGSCSFMGDKCKCVSDQDLAGQEWAKRQAILAHCHARDGYERVFSSIHVQSAQRPGATPPLAHEWPRARRFLRWPTTVNRASHRHDWGMLLASKRTIMGVTVYMYGLGAVNSNRSSSGNRGK